jgi:hypothetical protein
MSNLGVCEPAEFAKAMEKVGVVVPTKGDLTKLFNYYD